MKRFSRRKVPYHRFGVMDRRGHLLLCFRILNIGILRKNLTKKLVQVSQKKSVETWQVGPLQCPAGALITSATKENVATSLSTRIKR